MKNFKRCSILKEVNTTYSDSSNLVKLPIIEEKDEPYFLKPSQVKKLVEDALAKQKEEFKKTLPSVEEFVDIITKHYLSQNIDDCDTSRKLAKAIHKAIRGKK